MGSVRRLDEQHDCCPSCTLLCRNGRVVADAMGLRDWTVTVGHNPPVDPQETMTVDLAGERKLMRLRAAEVFWELGDRDRSHHLAHECCHALLRDLHETVRAGVAGELSGTALRIFMGQVGIETERLVDVLASVIAPGLPPLEW